MFQNQTPSPEENVFSLYRRLINISLYQGPDPKTLPPIVQKRLETLLGRALEVSQGKHTNWTLCCNCKLQTNGDLGGAEESIIYQRDDFDDSPPNPEAYKYNDRSLSIAIDVIDRNSGRQELHFACKVFSALSPLLESDFLGGYQDDIEIMMSYRIVAVTRRIEEP